jgi:L-arabinose transport system permease protein
MLRGMLNNTSMIVVFGLLFVLVALFVPNFLSIVNMNGLALSVATVGIVASTMLFCLVAGDFDLSVGSVVAFAGVLSAVVIDQTGNISYGILSGILAGGIIGVVNGVVIASLGINALITTLGTMQIVRGLCYIISDGKAVGVREASFTSFGVASFMNVPDPVWIMAFSFLLFGVLLKWTVFGRHALAIGGNAEAARLAGIRVSRVKITIFGLQGAIAAMAGILLASRMSSGQPGTAQGLELQVISACVLGGVSLRGGIGTMTGVIVGVLIMGTVQNAMNLLNVPPFYQYVTSGAILLTAVMIDRLKRSL